MTQLVILQPSVYNCEELQIRFHGSVPESLECLSRMKAVVYTAKDSSAVREGVFFLIFYL